MFLKNGFDGFVSKPIDSRELNLILNEFIRNKKPPEVVEDARRKLLEKRLMAIDNIDGSAPVSRKELSGEHKDQESVRDSVLDIFFINDAESAINILEPLLIKTDAPNDEDINSYITAVHGLKSALANINEKELSDIATKLEQAGRKKNIVIISDETPPFISALKSLILKIKPVEEFIDLKNFSEDMNLDENVILEEKIIFENQDYLCEKLLEIKTACSTMDKKTAKAALKDLKQKKWPGQIDTVLNDITLHMLHSEFNDAAKMAGNTLEYLKG